MNILGIGKIGSAIADKFKSYPQYKIFKINSDIIKNNDNEFYLDEFTDCYKWDKDQTIADFLQSNQLADYSEDQQKQIAEFLNDNLPDYLDYN